MDYNQIFILLSYAFMLINLASAKVVLKSSSNAIYMGYKLK